MVVLLELAAKFGLHGLHGKSELVQRVHIRKWFDFWFYTLVISRWVTVTFHVSSKRPLF